MLLFLCHLHDNGFALFQHSPGFLRQLNDRVFVIGHRKVFVELKVVYHLSQLVGRHFGKFRVVGIFIHMILSDLCRIGSVHRINNHVRAVSLSAALHASDDPFCDIRHIHRFKLA